MNYTLIIIMSYLFVYLPFKYGYLQGIVKNQYGDRCYKTKLENKLKLLNNEKELLINEERQGKITNV